MSSSSMMSQHLAGGENATPYSLPLLLHKRHIAEETPALNVIGRPRGICTRT